MKKFLVGMIGIGVAVGFFAVKSMVCAGEGERVATAESHTQTPEASRRVIMMPVSVVGTPTSGEETGGPQIRLYTADATAVPVIPVGMDFVYASREDQGRPAGANANTLEVTIPVTLIGAPGPGETGYLRKIQVFFVVGDEKMPRIPTDVRIVYASGEKPSLVSLESDVSRGGWDLDPVAASVCAWQKVDGVDHCVGTCDKGICALYTVDKDGHQITKCGCIIIVAVPVNP